MKKILYKPIYILQLFCIVTAFAILSACEKNDEVTAPPVITEVRNYAASPDDTLVQTLTTGQWVVVLGENLGEVSSVLFGSTPAFINSTLTTDKSIVIQVPGIPFQTVPKDKVNVITVVNGSGSVSFEINITGPPLITHMRNYDAAPNDTIVDKIFPGQHLNIIGFNIKDATSIAFQGLEIDLTAAVYTDSSVIVDVPADFSGADPALSNKLAYTTAFGSSTFPIIVFDPALLKFYSDPLYTLLTGGIDKEKTWVIDMDPATGKSKVFMGPIMWSGLDLGFDRQCGPGGSCWTYEVEYQGWFPAVKDYGTMTFKLKGSPIIPKVTVVQKNGSESQNGTFTGDYFMDIASKTITFTGVTPLNMGWQYVWTKAQIIALTEDGMQLGFKDPGKAEYAVHNYVKK